MSIVIDKAGPEGNAFAIMGQVKKILEQTDRAHEWPEIQEKMMADDYDALCKVAEEETYGLIEIYGGF